MKKYDKLLAARVTVGVLLIAFITLTLVLYHEYSETIYLEVERGLAASMNNADAVAGK